MHADSAGYRRFSATAGSTDRPRNECATL